MDPFNFKNTSTTADLYFNSLDSMPLILALIESKFSPT